MKRWDAAMGAVLRLKAMLDCTAFTAERQPDADSGSGAPMQLSTSLVFSFRVLERSYFPCLNDCTTLSLKAISPEAQTALLS